MNYTIKANGETIAQTDLVYVAALVGSTYAQGDRDVLIMNNGWGRVAYNSKTSEGRTHADLAKQLIDKEDQFRIDYNRKLSSGAA